MKVAVWDTYVTRKDGRIMNFDILVPESQTDKVVIYGYGKIYLESKGIPNYTLTTNHCSLCHIEKATEPVIASIEQHGYHIVELKNCE